MKSLKYKTMTVVLCVGAASFANAADEENAKALQSYSVGDRRGALEQQEIKIERPKFETNFKIDMPKPSMGNMQIQRPNLEILAGPEPAPAGTTPAPQRSEPTRTASASGAPPSVTPPSQGFETRPVRPVQMDAPSYPRDAYLRREEGFVIVEFTVNANGETEDINVVEAEPRDTFDREARRTVSRWRFEPALRDGRPVPQRIRHTLEFTLNR